MQRWMAAAVILAAAIGWLAHSPPTTIAQPKDGPAPEAFMTPDGMELIGLFHPTRNAKDNKPSEAPVVVFLYPPGIDQDMTKGDWASLAKKLNENGYHVFQFDWRGHGKSKNIKDKDKFWGNSYLNRGQLSFNKYIRGGPPKMPLKGDLDIKDLGTNAIRYMPAYLNDLAGVRFLLDTKNDKGELNTSSIYFVGAGDAAALGFAWLAAEWTRPQVAPNVNQLGIGIPRYEYVPQPLVGGIFNEAGNDYGGAVWLTASRPASFPEATIKRWVADQRKIRENNPMLFLYAEKDAKGRADSSFYFDQVLVAKPRKGSNLTELPQTFMHDVKGAEKLQGVKLLGERTEGNIVEYFAAIQKTRARIAAKPREYKDLYFVDVLAFGLRP